MKEQLKEYWQGRSSRDRRIIAMVGTIVVVVVAYAYLWLPMDQARTRLRSEVPQLQGGAAQMALQAQEAARLKALPAPAARGTPQEMINQSAERAGIKSEITQVTPLSSERVQVTLNAVSFDRWIGWAKTLATEFGLRVESAQIAAAGDPGMVKVQAVLALPGR